MGDDRQEIIIIPYTGGGLGVEDLLATKKLSRPSAVRLLKKYSDDLSRCCHPKGAVVPLKVSYAPEGITLEGRIFGNSHIRELMEGCATAWLYYATSGKELEGAQCFDSASMRDMFAFAAMLRMMDKVQEYFRTVIGLKDPVNLLSQAAGEFSENDTDLLKELGSAAMEKLGIHFDSHGIMRPWNTLWGIMYEKKGVGKDHFLGY